MNNNRYYVYALLDPSDNDNIFYIGKGVGRRVYTHYQEANLRKVTLKSKVIREYRTLGFNDKFITIEQGLSNKEALLLEQSLILKYGRKNIYSGELTNMTDGGENPPVHFGKSNPTHRLIEKGTSPAKIASSRGTHQLLGVKPWKHYNSTEASKYIWMSADALHSIYIENNSIGWRQAIRLFQNILGIKIGRATCNNLLRYFKSGWVPDKDKEWKSYKINFKKENS